MLDQIELAKNQLEWASVRSFAHAVMALDAESSGTLKYVEYAGNYLDRIVGTDPGQGYGLFVGVANNVSVYANIHHNVVVDASRHSIYAARGDDVIIAHNHVLDHRSTDGTGGGTRAAISSARGSHRSIVGNVIENAKDGCLELAASPTVA